MQCARILPLASMNYIESFLAGEMCRSKSMCFEGQKKKRKEESGERNVTLDIDTESDNLHTSIRCTLTVDVFVVAVVVVDFYFSLN